jgi:hypothetical protein
VWFSFVTELQEGCVCQEIFQLDNCNSDGLFLLADFSVGKLNYRKAVCVRRFFSCVN